MHGGKITATSEGLGRGSCFAIELPIANQTTISDGFEDGTKEMTSDQSRNKKSHFFLRSLSYFSILYRPLLRFLLRYRRVEANPNANESQIDSRLPMFLAFNGSVKKDDVSSPRGRAKLDYDLGNCKHELMNDDDCIKAKVDHDEIILLNEKSSIDINCNAKSIRNSNLLNESSSATEDDNRRYNRVLIVDDVPMNRKMLKRLLIGRFYECFEAENGQQAVDMVKESIDMGIDYDIITMDYQMPVMDGVTATRCIRKLGYKGQIIGVTGNALLEDVNSLITNGANVVLTKPLSIAKFDEYLSTLT